ncbi:Uncharacterized protein BM_BM17840 [Brugia malayi]|uniref:C2H2-type domain-containing protein n=1 Tax=Brugia malayi TaxID=6279 RepID=A0A4E9FRZ5_BRUMA|nr:Uncharacterized protein BM_BM17840 [Brugia malayi]VIO99527.1 Uncharacterized protein BM_BM17840 [Brugia malayi]
MKEHMMTHTGEKPYSCPICKKNFIQPVHMKEHMMTHTGEKPYSCPICGKCSSRKQDLQTHMVAQTDQTESLDLSISKIKKEGSESQGLSVETESDGRIKLLEQLLPIETMMEVMELSKQKESTRKKQRCNVCQKEVFGNMKMHMLTHTGEKPYSCSMCKKNFTQFGNMKMHKLTHTGEKPYSCPICGKCSSRKQDLQTHMVAQTDQTESLDLSISKIKKEGSESQGLSVETESDGRIKLLERLLPIETMMEVMELSKQKESTRKKQRCNVCQKEMIKDHMMTHTCKKPYSCSICKRDFAEFGNMKKHMMIHTGEKPYSCSICKKNFTQFGNMKRHMMTHTSEKSYSCSICKENFTQYGDMKMHMLIHTGKKPYSCSICKRNFTQFWNIKTHMLTHTGEKPYSCSTHIATHDMNRPMYRCTVCSKGFRSKLGLKLHMQNH